MNTPSAIARMMRALCLLFFLIVPAVAAAQSDEQPSATPNEQLAELLENESTRQALIEQLRRTADASPAVAEAAQADGPSLPQRIAGLTQSIAERTMADTNAALLALNDARTRLAGDGATRFMTQLAIFAAFAASVLVVFWLLGRIAQGLYARLDRRARADDPAFALVRRGGAIVAAIGVHLATVVLAWLAGYAIALFVLGDDGGMRRQESLFLNAFLIVEGVRVLIGTLLSNRHANLRLVPADSEEAAYWSAWASRMTYFLGYGLMLLVPAAAAFIAPEVGRILAILVMVLAWLKATVIVMQNRARVRAALDRLASRMHSGFARVALSMGGRVWHVFAVTYLAALIIIAVFYREEALGFMLSATMRTVIAILAGIVISALLTAIILRRIRLPEDTRARFPLLEDRLNAYVPGALKLTRFAILAIVLAFILDAWTSFDLGVWAASDAGMTTLGKIVTVAIIVTLALAAWLLAASWIEYRLNPDANGGEATPRVRTLLTIFRNAVAITLIVLTTMVVLAEIGVNIAPLIAGAGVLGLAIGFGAQKLVQDVITGVFIQLEGAINVGDLVTAGGTTGTVEKLTIRSLGMRDLSGVYHLLPFSSVDTVSNFMRGFGYHVGEYGVAYREDTDVVIEHLKAAFEELRQDPEHSPNILGDLEVHGVTALADSSVNVRVRIKAVAGTQFGVGRAYNRLVKRHFDAAGIEIPFPHMTLYFGEDKQGKAPPANLRLLDGREDAPGDPA